MTTRKFHVYIIESPSPVDLYHKRFEGEALRATLELSQIPASHCLAVSYSAFTAAFHVGLVEHFGAVKNPPIIHISAHGDDEGIQLTSGEVVTWETLRKFLQPVNQILKDQGGFILCMSTCKGAAGCKMAMDDDEYPFRGVVGNNEEPTWSETNIGFATFYHLFAKGCTMFDCVEAMKVSSGNEHFTFIEAATARRAYLNTIKDPQYEPLQKLEQNIPRSEPREFEKALMSREAHATGTAFE